MNELNEYYYYEDPVINPSTHLYRVYHADEADVVIAHQAYKRCLAMAKWCMARYNEWAAYYPTTTTRKMKFLDKWHKRWREIAEKFKEAK